MALNEAFERPMKIGSPRFRKFWKSGLKLYSTTISSTPNAAISFAAYTVEYPTTGHYTGSETW